MRLLRRRKSKPPTQRALWSVAPKLRALKPGEALEAGAAVLIEGDTSGTAWRLVEWMECGREQRYALLDCGRCPVRHVVRDSHIRIVDDGAQAKRKGRR